MSPDERAIQQFTTDWQGIALSVTYEANWLNLQSGSPVAHLTVTTISPIRGPLPITETGFRSQYLDPQEIEEAGGPVAYLLAWLDEAAKEPAWKRVEERSRQLTLF